MRRLLSLMVGLGLGIGVGWLVVTLFSPVSGTQLRANARAHYEESLAAARRAAAERRAELEAELAELRGESR